MPPSKAWRWGLGVLAAYPWLPLIPLGWDLVRMLLAWFGLPLSPAVDVGLFSDNSYEWFTPFGSQTGTTSFTVRGFLPSWLPSVEDLQVSLQPKSLTLSTGLPMWTQWVALVLLPFFNSVTQAVFLVLLAQIVTAGAPGLRDGWRQAIRAVPALYVLALLPRIALLVFPHEAVLVLTIAFLLIFPLLNVTIVAGDMPLLQALKESPRHFWGRLGDWFGLGWRAMLTTAVFHLGWTLLGQHVAVGLALYPFLGTWLVAGAVALYLNPEEAPEPKRAPWWSWALTVAAIPLALTGSHLSAEWSGYQPTREQAIARGSFDPYMVIQIMQVHQSGDGELVLYRRGWTNETGITKLAHSRFGWKRVWASVEDDLRQDQGKDQPPPLGAVMRTYPPYQDVDLVLCGEVYDQRVAYLQFEGIRYPVNQDSYTFLLPVQELPEVDSSLMRGLLWLDANGNILGEGEAL